MGKAAKANPRKRQKGEDGAAAAAAAVGAEDQEQVCVQRQAVLFMSTWAIPAPADVCKDHQLVLHLLLLSVWPQDMTSLAAMEEDEAPPPPAEAAGGGGGGTRGGRGRAAGARHPYGGHSCASAVPARLVFGASLSVCAPTPSLPSLFSAKKPNLVEPLQLHTCRA